MAGPWEKYQKSAESSAGPWTKYAGSPVTDKVLDESNPDITWGERALIKNFGNDNQASIDYLKSKHPGLEIKDLDGEIVARSNKNVPWTKLDPGGYNPLQYLKSGGLTELVQDAGDILYDVGGGVAQNAATVAAGLGAGAVTGGAGAIPAAIATSGTTGAGIEAVRQNLGKYFGVNKDVKNSDIAISGIAGGIMPAAFGVGQTAKQLTAKVARQGLEKEAANALTKQLESSARGGVGRAYDAGAGYFGPKVASIASGIKESVIKALPDNYANIKASEVNPSVVAEEFTPAMEKLSAAAKNEYQQVGKLMGETLDKMEATGNRLDISDINKSMNELRDEIKLYGTDSSVDKAALKEIEDILPSLFTTKKEVNRLVMDPNTGVLTPVKEIVSEQITSLSPKEAMLKKQQIKELARQYGSRIENSGSSTGAGGSIKNTMDKRISGVLNNISTELDDKIIKSSGPELGQTYGALQNAYSAAKETAEDFAKYSNKTEAFGQLLNKAQQNPYAETLLTKLASAAGEDVDALVNKAGAFKTFRKPSIEALSGSSTSTSKSVPLSGAMGTLGYGIGQASGGAISPFLAASLGQAGGGKLASPAFIRKAWEMNNATRSSTKAGRTAKSTVPFWTKMALGEKLKEEDQ